MAIMESIALELKSIRYLINNIIITIQSQNELLALLLAKNNIKPEPKKKIKKKDIIIADGIKFDLFTLSKTQYNSLVEDYGYDTVTRACAMLDNYVREKGYVPYGKPAMALRKVMILHALKEKLEDAKLKITTFKDIDSNLIDNKKDAVAFIQSVPKHIRNVSPEVRALQERFNLSEDD